MSQRHLPDQDDVAADLAIFHAAIDGTTPLRQENKISFEPPKPSARPRQRELDEAAAITESMHGTFSFDDLLSIGDADSYLRSGVQRSVLRDLRRGRWSIQSHIDLHGMNRHEAHEAISRFMADTLKAGKRCIRIVHGRGHGSPGREGILRKLVKSWLVRRQDVLAFCHAPHCDGGNGALWVLLRSSQSVKRKAY